MEVENKCDVFVVNYKCDECGLILEFGGQCLACNPPKYLHVCNCGKRYELRKKYPYDKYVLRGE